MGNAAQFAAELDAFGMEIEVEALAHKREVSLELLAGCVFGTPVGNPRLWKRKAPKGYVGGFHRGQWQLTISTPAEAEVSLRTPQDVLSEADGVVLTLEEPAWVANNGPAITRLEYDGHSRQAPDGWVRAVVERLKAKHGAD